jgi:uncharacterized alkaline shock family protein YloU
MAIDDHAPAGPLPCGTLLEDLIAQVTEGTAPLDRAHQAACRYCQTALEAIRQAWEDFQSLARKAVAVPDDLAERVMDRIRSLARITGEGVTIAADHGETRITLPVIGRLARAAARSVDDVVWVSVVGVSEDSEQPGSVMVSLRLVVTLGPALEQVAARVRERVIEDIAGQAGAAVARVDVDVEDVAVIDESS